MRIGDRWRDQGEETGHRARAADIARIRSLGIRTVRYPLLWEKAAPERPDRFDFSWTDERLAMLEEQGIEVIAGLLHHGSGPAYTHLLDPDFARKFAGFAAAVAERYPRLRRWTPINEPLTTARFSCLYGHWYPHFRSARAFVRALVNQCAGIREAMAAIRAVNPAAQLVQTDDLGKTFSTGPLRYQADHENVRRWLTFDLLAGRVTSAHPLHAYLTGCGIGPAELEAFEGGSATPDLIGVNHYLTSERFLDHRCHLYPELEPGGNGRDTYVDAEAVRVPGLETGLAPRLREAWRRYRIPLAITEVHHGCTRDEQLRWLAETVGAAETVRAEGVDLRAVTLWSLFGCVDWRSLLVREEGAYDAGAFDVRGAAPRPTAIAAAAAVYAGGGRFRHPVLDEPGWWRRSSCRYSWCAEGRQDRPTGRPILITGATGTLGRALARIAAHRGLAVHLTSRSELDISDAASIRHAIGVHRPWAVVNAAGFVRVADAERESEACLAANCRGPELLARACREGGIPLVTFSSDLVFDGTRGEPLRESDPVAPLCTYGRSKAEAERLVLEAGGQALVIRTSAFFGPWDRYNFAWDVLRRLASGERVRACASTTVSPTFVPDLCHAVLDLLVDGEQGIWHLANQGALSWYAFACAVASAAGLGCSRIEPMREAPARHTALVSERGNLLRPLDQAISAYLRDLEMPFEDRLAAAE